MLLPTCMFLDLIDRIVVGVEKQVLLCQRVVVETKVTVTVLYNYVSKN